VTKIPLDLKPQETLLISDAIHCGTEERSISQVGSKEGRGDFKRWVFEGCRDLALERKGLFGAGRPNIIRMEKGRTMAKSG